MLHLLLLPLALPPAGCVLASAPAREAYVHVQLHRGALLLHLHAHVMWSVMHRSLLVADVQIVHLPATCTCQLRAPLIVSILDMLKQVGTMQLQGCMQIQILLPLPACMHMHLHTHVCMWITDGACDGCAYELPSHKGTIHQGAGLAKSNMINSIACMLTAISVSSVPRAVMV